MAEMKFLGMDFSCALRSLRNGEIPEKDCLLPLISKLLGYCIVAASTTVKLPQILKILKHSSIRGLSVVAFELEVVGYTIALAYCLHKGLPFSAYGELAFLLIQEQKYRGAQLFNFFNEFCRFHGEGLYQHPRKGTNERDYGLCDWHHHKWYHLKSDNHIPKAACKERKESGLEKRDRVLSRLALLQL
ncbi:mannose-p-dolichol utilization defect 1 protein homolog 2 [Phtheirospermum japonicum]|uniref:Mannose-p-dolichol utilization defect 1 protein homolog 2 n=1 Tax=Phtheirospermum japonicum TaxID=374723 RepID=A0A830BGM8_9LAMI|nr:mannose-p-dolichol utilization defect 1 protein homolog 2 [Phtheirospermum japonicum]